MPVDAECWSTGISTEPDTHGPEAAPRAPILIREGRTQQGKCFVFSSSIRSPRSKATSVGGRSRLLGPKRTSSLVMAVSGYSVLPRLGRLVAKAGIRLRGSLPDCADVHGEGWIPVPLPPSKW